PVLVDRRQVLDRQRLLRIAEYDLGLVQLDRNSRKRLDIRRDEQSGKVGCQLAYLGARTARGSSRLRRIQIVEMLAFEYRGVAIALQVSPEVVDRIWVVLDLFEFHARSLREHEQARTADAAEQIVDIVQLEIWTAEADQGRDFRPSR